MDKLKVVFFTGAGISAESGIQTFRDNGGLWDEYRIEDVCTPDAFARNPQYVLDFYNKRRAQLDEVEPNDAHKIIAEMEEEFDVTVITQNVDDLHERGGSTNIIHLHGELRKMRSVRETAGILECKGDINVGDLASDGGQLRPHIVWFNESVPMMSRAIIAVSGADVFVVVGSSLEVYPAASLLGYTYQHTPVYIVDPNPPTVTVDNNVIPLQGKATEKMPELRELLRKLKPYEQ